MKNFYTNTPIGRRSGASSFFSTVIGIAVLLLAILVFSYILLWGLLIGGLVYLYVWARSSLRVKQAPPTTKPDTTDIPGPKTFEYDPGADRWNQS